MCRDTSHGTEANRFRWLRVADLNHRKCGFQAETIMRSAMPCSGDGEREDVKLGAAFRNLSNEVRA
jgi:hypothetical protein